MLQQEQTALPHEERAVNEHTTITSQEESKTSIPAGEETQKNQTARRYRFDRPKQSTQAIPVTSQIPQREIPLPPPAGGDQEQHRIENSTQESSTQTPQDTTETGTPAKGQEIKSSSDHSRRRRRKPNPIALVTNPPEQKIADSPHLLQHMTEEPLPNGESLIPTRQEEIGLSGTLEKPIAIVSGYTVGQLNQRQNGVSPFLSPEPAPATGAFPSAPARNGLNGSRSGTYAPRSSELGTLAREQSLLSTLTQAIQSQTDRLAAELRRSHGVPANISVQMPPLPSTERVGVFVDVANLLYAAKNTQAPIDFGKMLDFLRGNRRLVRAHAYCPTSPLAGDEQIFLQAVQGLGYRITTKDYKTFASGAKKADLDLDLCMDVVRLVDGRAVDCIVLVSGDADFLPMLEYCTDHGVRVEVAAFNESLSATLRQGCDIFINLGMVEEIRA